MGKKVAPNRLSINANTSEKLLSYFELQSPQLHPIVVDTAKKHFQPNVNVC